jgi:flavorubredoxin
VKLAGICLKGLSMSVVTIVYYSGYGHTAKQAEAVAEGIRSASATAKVYRLTDQGDLPEGMTLEDIGQTDAIIYGSPKLHGRARLAVQEIRGRLLEVVRTASLEGQARRRIYKLRLC